MGSRKRAIVLGAAVALLLSGSTAAGTSALAAPRIAQTWGTAIEVPGTAALNQGGAAGITSMSCASAGNCSAGGLYKDGSGRAQAFVVSEVSGIWGTAIRVPGTGTLNRRGTAAGTSAVSCAAAGNCSAGGDYTDSSSREQVFVASQVNGAWHTAIELPGMAALNQGGGAQITSMSCTSPGNCSAGGYYRDGSSHTQAFVVSQVGRTWGTAIEVPGIAALNQDGFARVNSVSCGSRGNCVAGGSYLDGHGLTQALVVSQVNGTWGTARKVPGTAALNQGGDARLTSVSCSPGGNCSAGGDYSDGSGVHHVFVISRVNGTWGTAIEVPGMAALGPGGADLTSVSCGSAGNCSAGGDYGPFPINANSQAFVVSQVNGTWGTAIEVPGTAALNTGEAAGVTSVSCASAGNCSAAGSYRDSSRAGHVFVVDEANGTWGTAIEVPGTAALNQGGLASIGSLSCSPAGTCSMGGDYIDGSAHDQAFVDSQS
jgi:hypothetical protein